MSYRGPAKVRSRALEALIASARAPQGSPVTEALSPAEIERRICVAAFVPVERSMAMLGAVALAVLAVVLAVLGMEARPRAGGAPLVALGIVLGTAAVAVVIYARRIAEPRGLAMTGNVAGGTHARLTAQHRGAASRHRIRIRRSRCGVSRSAFGE